MVEGLLVHSALSREKSGLLLGDKQELLKATVELENYDLIAVTETWWDESHDWSAAIDGYKLFRRDRQGRNGGGDCLLCKKNGSIAQSCLRKTATQRLRAYG